MQLKHQINPQLHEFFAPSHAQSSRKCHSTGCAQPAPCSPRATGDMEIKGLHVRRVCLWTTQRPRNRFRGSR
jgi:hypothetical protein